MPFKILVADDDVITRRIVENVISKNGYDVVSCQNGTEAWEHLSSPRGPKLAILDWVMPGMQGIEICKKIREQKLKINPYLIILTASMNEKKDVLESFRTGANDYIEKPFDSNELIARVKLGEKLIKLQIELSERIKALEEAYQHIRTLQGILPICMHCHNIRNDNESWERVEEYISRHTDAQFSHGLCPKCMKKYYPEISPN
jgi:sigma-B regulation protein RsbU (phosphoserine phosphatase)